MRYFILLIIFSLILAGCATNQGGYTKPDQVVNRLKQLSESEVAMMLGAPTEKVELSDGSQTWTYRDDSEGLTGGECTISLVIKAAKVTNAMVTARDRSWVSYPLGSCQNILANLN
jgi:hypothetical protein